jgi:deoxyadenosine/deoxycytidine kinase
VRVSIEGGIGVGKSTVLEALRAHFADDDTVCFLTEPVDTWISSGLLGRMYDKTISGLSFQIIAAATRFGPLARLFHDPRLTVFVTERSLASDKDVFARVTLDPTTEWPDYELAAKQLRDAMPTDVKEVTVYLDATDEEVMARIHERKRTEEKAIPMDYLARLRAAHEAFYESIEHEKVRVDASRDAASVAYEVAAIVERTRASLASPTSSSPSSDDDDDDHMISGTNLPKYHHGLVMYYGSTAEGPPPYLDGTKATNRRTEVWRIEKASAASHSETSMTVN